MKNALVAVSSSSGIHDNRLPHKTNTSLDNICNKSVDMDVLHARLGHVSLSKMKHKDHCDYSVVMEYNCDICLLANQHKEPFDVSFSRTSHCFDLVHLDLWGLYRVLSTDGAAYFLTILDDHSRIVWTYLLHNKQQVLQTISDFLVLVETQYNSHVRMVRSDNGSEFIQRECRRLFAARGIVQQNSAPYVPQQNGRMERKHIHLIEVSRALRFQGNLLKNFWGERVLTANHIINKLPTKVLGWKTSNDVLFNKPPSYEELRVFGCLCYAYNTHVHRGKIYSRSRKCLMIGDPYGQKAYKLYDLTSHKIFVSRDVIFFETIFLYSSFS